MAGPVFGGYKLTGVSEGAPDKALLTPEEDRRMKEELGELMKLGLTKWMAATIHASWMSKGFEALKKRLQTKPYELMEIHGIGFRKADQIALMLGHQVDGVPRIEAGVETALEEGMSLGNLLLTWPQGELAVAKLLGREPEGRTLEVVRTVLSMKEVSYQGRQYVAARKAVRVEEDLRDSLGAALRTCGDAWEDIGERIEANDVLTDLQKGALREVCRKGVGVFTGEAGSGKTTSLKVLVKALEAEVGDVLLVAPTGKAARRLKEVVGHAAMTVHRAVSKVRQQNEANEKARGKAKAKGEASQATRYETVVLDESSMVDIFIFRDLLAELGEGVRVILTGDPHQIPSIAPGAVLRDALNSGVCARGHLDVVHRVEGGAEITELARQIRGGKLLQREFRGVRFIRVESASEAFEHVAKILKESKERSDAAEERGEPRPENPQVLVAKKAGYAGRDVINAMAANLWRGKAAWVNGFFDGCRVVCTKNNYQAVVMNGETGFLDALSDTGESRPQGFFVDDGDGIRTPLNPGIKDQEVAYEMAYAMTVHKSQGSEYDTVVMVVVQESAYMWTRKLLYTAATRAKKELVVIYQAETWRNGLSNVREEARQTRLSGLLGRIR